MTAVARMVRLDLHSVAPYRRQLLLFIAIAVVMGISVESPSRVLPMVTVYAVLIASYPFAVADKDDLDTLYGVLPLTRRVVLLGHYAVAVSIFLAAALTGTVLALLFSRLREISVAGIELAVLLTVSWGVFTAIVSIQFPLFVRLGYSRARLLAIMPFAALLAAGIVVAPRLHSGGKPGPVWFGLVLAAGALALVVSFVVAARIDPRRVE